MKIITIIALVTVALCLSSCGGDSTAGSGLTIKDRIEIAAQEAAVDSLAGTWKDGSGGSTYAVGSPTVIVSDDIEISFTKTTGRYFEISSISMGSVVDDPSISATNGAVTYDSIADTMTIVAIGTLTDTDGSVPIDMRITMSGVNLATLSEANMFTFSSCTMVIDYNSGERSISYDLTPGMLPLTL